MDHKPPLIYQSIRPASGGAVPVNTQGAHALVILSESADGGVSLRNQVARRIRPCQGRRVVRAASAQQQRVYFWFSRRPGTTTMRWRRIASCSCWPRRQSLPGCCCKAACSGAARPLAGARGLGDASGGRPDIIFAGPIRVSGPHFSRRLDGPPRLVGDPRTSFLEVGRGHGALSNRPAPWLRLRSIFCGATERVSAAAAIFFSSSRFRISRPA